MAATLQPRWLIERKHRDARLIPIGTRLFAAHTTVSVAGERLAAARPRTKPAPPSVARMAAQ
jgi:hypothetical protein